MSHKIEHKLIDKNSLSRVISKYLKKEMMMRDMSNKEIALKLKWRDAYFANVLNSKPTNNSEVYRAIAQAI